MEPKWRPLSDLVYSIDLGIHMCLSVSRAARRGAALRMVSDVTGASRTTTQSVY